MAISPAAGERVAIYIARIYADAEQEVIRKLARAIEGGEEDIEKWAEGKLADLSRVRRDIKNEVIGDLDEHVPPEIEERLEDIYKRGQESAVADLRRVLDEDDIEVTEGFTRTNRRTVEALARDTIEKTEAAHLRIVRSATDEYRRIVSKTAEEVATGVSTRMEASQSALSKFANRGITGFVDEAGRSWNLQSYCETAIRSASGRAAIRGQIDRTKENGRDLMVVSDHAEECELCRPWEGRVVSIDGDDPNYPPLSQAEADGLFHPNCRHNLGAYIHGLTKTPDPDPDPRGYEERQQQRYIERNIRKWKRREAGAISDKERDKSRNKVREWQARMADFVEATDRRRKYEREQIHEAW